MRAAGAPIILLMLVAGCAIASTREYRSGIFIHRTPTYSFRVPDDWRPAREEDLPSFGYMQLAMRLATPDRQPRLLDGARDAFRKADAVLISPRGAGIIVMHRRNSSGERIPLESALTEKEKATVLKALMKGAEGGPKEITIESADLVSYGRTPALKINVRAGDILPMRMRTDPTFGVQHFADVLAFIASGRPLPSQRVQAQRQVRRR